MCAVSEEEYEKQTNEPMKEQNKRNNATNP